MATLLDLFKLGRRRCSLPSVAPEELKQRLDRGETLTILDLRHPLDFLPDPRVIPGAIRISPSELATRQAEIPRDREIVLYCTCPNNAATCKLASVLVDRGVTRLHVLDGGFPAWRERGYPLIEFKDNVSRTKSAGAA